MTFTVMWIFMFGTCELIHIFVWKRETGKSARIVQITLGATVKTLVARDLCTLAVCAHTHTVGRRTKCVVDGELCSERKYDLFSLYRLQ